MNTDTRNVLALSYINRFFRDLVWHELRSRKAQFQQGMERQRWFANHVLAPGRERLRLRRGAVNLRADNF